MKNMVPTFGKDEPRNTEFVKQSEYDAKVLELENSIKGKAGKDEIPTIPDHSIYALKEEIPKDYLKKEDLPKPIDTSNFVTKEEVEKFATKDDLPDLKPYIKKENLPDFNTLATKAELELKASIGDMAKKVSIEDMEKYKSAIDESLKSKLNKSETYTRQEVKDRYIKKDAHQKDLEKKMDKVLLPDFETFARKSDLDGLVGKECVDLRPYLKKEEVETCYCFVKLENNFRFYDGESHDHEIYLGGRGVWNVQYDTHKKIYKHNAQSNFDYYAPFDGLYLIDYTITVQRDSYTMKPQVLQRIRTSAREVINWDYFDTSLVGSLQKGESTTRTFIKTATIYLKAGQWVKFSIQFTNRAYNNKKMWLHCIGAQGVYTPTYFSITGTKKAI